MSCYAGPNPPSPKRKTPPVLPGDSLKDVGRSLSRALRRKDPLAAIRYEDSTHARRARNDERKKVEEFRRKPTLELVLELVRREYVERERQNSRLRKRMERARKRAAVQADATGGIVTLASVTVGESPDGAGASPP